MTDLLDRRDLSAMYADDKCVICGTPRVGAPGHLLQHLADASAIVHRNGTTGRERIVPTSGVPGPAKDGPPPEGVLPFRLGARRPDAKLLALAKAAQKRSQQ